MGLGWFLLHYTLSVHGLMFGWLYCGCCRFCLDSGNDDDDGGGWLAGNDDDEDGVV